MGRISRNEKIGESVLIYIDDKLVTETEFLNRVRIEDEQQVEFADEFLDLFLELGISPFDEYGCLKFTDDLVGEVSLAYLRFLDFYDVEMVDEYIN